MRFSQAGILLSVIVALGCADRIPTDSGPVQSKLSTAELVPTTISQAVVFFSADYEAALGEVECSEAGTFSFYYVQRAVILLPGKSRPIAARVLTQAIIPPGGPFGVSATFDCGGFQVFYLDLPGIWIAVDNT